MNGERVQTFGPYESHPFVNLLNEDGAEFARENTEAASRKAIELVYNNIAFRLNQDSYTSGEGKAFVQHDILTAPMNDNEPVDTYCIRLEPKLGQGENPDKIKYLELHIPSGEADISLYEMPPKFDVKEVYAAVVGEETHWFALTQNGVYEYVPRAQQDNPSDIMLDDQGMWRGFDERIPESYLAMHTLFQKIINWRTEKQPLSGNQAQ